MNKDSKIFVAGHRGMVGSAIVRGLVRHGYGNIATRTRSELPLDDMAAVDAFFQREQPEYVFLAAAKVGGIVANATMGADFIRENLLIQNNVIHAAWANGARKLMFLGSSCIYPRLAAQPVSEDALLTGPLEETNLPYAVAKIAGKVMCDAYRKQYGFDAFTVMPSNVYGQGDNFHPEHSHVVAGMMRRFHEAKHAGSEEVVVWGTGSPMRELIDADDLADACIFLMERWTDGGMVNAGSSQEISIRDLAHLLADIVGFKGRIVFDTQRPDGTPRKIMDNRRIEQLGWKPSTSIEAGLRHMYAWWLSTMPTPA
ncbi:GDP-L-fucose synthase family protein [Phreatobacter oligotrophus]|uniref:GDP-L-fucose synthase n=1 Tax=Phreatobacter oligotrophus TaxID=1122261 RepID=A0A2T4YP37_9HYPH|nr:GDP-L-fucose synthase [Phreatobacter oligotrophus]PTM45284.1 GDP-L-fucose synthase [Phreatobacter oligotrophus]